MFAPFLKNRTKGKWFLLFLLEKTSEVFDFVIKGDSIIAKQRDRIFREEGSSLGFKIKFLTPKYDDFEERIALGIQTVILKPSCSEAPMLTAIQNQKFSPKQTLTVTLWDKVLGDQAGKDLFWQFEGGANLDYNYDAQIGYLTVKTKKADWLGNDTVWISVQDMEGHTSKTSIVFESTILDQIDEIPAHLQTTYVYPNPTKNLLNIFLPQENGSIRLLDVTGQTKVSLNELDQNKVTLDLSGFTPGIYFLHIELEAGVVENHKVVVY
jgi:hypothetical protein